MLTVPKPSGLVLLVFAAFLLGGCARLTPPPTAIPNTTVVRPGAPPRNLFTHAFIIVEENREYGDIIGSPQAPYINHLAATYGLATDYYAVTHPSLPNYLALISGSTQGMTYDCADCSFDAPNLVDEFARHSITWKAYMEGLPSPCYNGTSAGSALDYARGSYYVRRHNPFMYFQDVANSPSRCQNVVPFSQFAADLRSGQVPDFVWITPNLANDMHNGTIRQGDDWLAEHVPAILRSNAWKNGGALFIVWDEGTSNNGCCGANGGRIPVLVITPGEPPSTRSATPYTHYSLLRTIEESWGLDLLGHSGDATTQPLSGFFTH